MTGGYAAGLATVMGSPVQERRVVMYKVRIRRK
jgi:hypothetical protein